MIKDFCNKYTNKQANNNNNYYYNNNYNATPPNIDHFFAFMETYFQLVDIDPKEQIPFTPIAARKYYSLLN